MFFVSRIWMITKKIFTYTVPVVVLSFIQLGAGMAQTFLVSIYGNYSALQYTERVSSTQAEATAACDVVITSILCWVLHDARSTIRKSFDGRLPYQYAQEKSINTESTINHLVLYAIERGAATSACALLNLVFLSLLLDFQFGRMIHFVPSVCRDARNLYFYDLPRAFVSIISHLCSQYACKPVFSPCATPRRRARPIRER
ncbi:hypothetical protein CPB84DRAFT_1773358 [Gymnopilus junonius]|uniref:DUF6534 domain-containing protein n=1 Tax=Gymnopilus junonius TaxID=109634 RepID=A0A9P5NUA1_GYMJU|nr:hypothetical protein CPB84DRAFT_1773358 [Gymnopilus junonius]